MALQKVLKFFTIHIDGVGGIGEYEEAKLPDIEFELKEYMAGGMISPVKINHGLKTIETELTAGGWSEVLLDALGKTTLTGVPIMFMGSIENDSNGEISAVEIHMRGRVEKLERDAAKQGDTSKMKEKFALAYYKEVWDGKTKIEIDPLNFICVLNGTDLYAEHKKNIGLV